MGSTNRMTPLLTFAACLVVVAPAAVEAQGQNGAQDPAETGQPWLTGRFVVHANGGGQVGSQELTDQFGYRAYGEDAQFNSTHEISGGALFDVCGSLRLWRELSVGGSYTNLQTTDRTTVTGRVPHPIQANNPRTMTPQLLSLDLREQVSHLFGVWRIPLVDKLDVSVFGGASFFNVTQGVVTNVTVTEARAAPFSAVDVEQVQRGEHRRNGIGGHAGVDVTYMVTGFVGVGFLARFTNGSVALPSADSGTLSLTVGGLQVGGGLRFRF